MLRSNVEMDGSELCGAKRAAADDGGGIGNSCDFNRIPGFPQFVDWTKLRRASSHYDRLQRVVLSQAGMTNELNPPGAPTWSVDLQKTDARDETSLAPVNVIAARANPRHLLSNIYGHRQYHR